MSSGVPDVEAYLSEVGKLNYTYQATSSDVPADFAGHPTDLYNDMISQVFGGNSSEAEQFFYSLYQTIVPGTGPQSIANFDAKGSWAKFVTALSAYPPNVGNNQPDNPTSGPLYELLLNHFKIQMGIPYDVSGNLGDFEPLYEAAATSGETRADFLNGIFTNVMNYFLTHYDFTIPDAAKQTEGGPNPSYDWLGEFTTNLSKFLSSRAALDTAPFPLGSSVNLSMYKKIFDEFVPQPPAKSFQDVLKEFYNDMMSRDGVFLPSLQLKDWIAKVQERQGVETNTLSSIAGTDSAKTAIILDLFRLLVEVINTLQKVAAAQGERLAFYAGFQKAYTDLIAQIPIITHQDIDFAIKSGDDKVLTAAGSFVQAQNQSFAETLRSFRSVLGDEAKQHQTTVNQSNEIVTQQANLGTSLLQELSTILTTMFK